ncbi:MAG: hypothetical protein MjAS7_1777 [Metallosphaera javensis (ex Sakai et al. 2022)]|nr:MAG: hypothetical protein MjAS7_1777 [Metallosphaera javensis (ex Sakai et al. 2022)]
MAIIAGQSIFILEEALILFSPVTFIYYFEYFSVINYFLAFLIDIILILNFLQFITSRLKYVLVLLFVPVVGQITEAGLIYYISRRRKIVMSGIYLALFLAGFLSSSFLQVPQTLYDIPILKSFTLSLAVSDVLNVLPLIYVFLLFRKWSKEEIKR